MSELLMLVTITNRNLAGKFLQFYEENHISVTLSTLGAGTATSETLDMFGLEATEKAVLYSFMTDSLWKGIKIGLYRKMNIDVPGTGIAFTIPLSSIGGKKTLDFLTENQDFVKGEESTMKETKFELLVAVANSGYIDVIMDAARSAGAGGGTVIHGKGTGMAGAEKFFGVSLSVEKEMVYIVTKKEQKNGIMKALMNQVGPGTKAGAIVFSLPVSSTAGIRDLDELQEE